MRVSILLLAFCLPACAYEPQFAIPDTTIDQNFRNVAAETKHIQDDLDTAESSLATAAQLASTQTFTGTNTFTNEVIISTGLLVTGEVDFSGEVNFSGATSTATVSGWVDVGFTVVTLARAGTDASAIVNCPTGYMVISGGYTVANNSSNRYIFSNKPILGTPNYWYVEFSGTYDNTWTAYALCARLK